MYFFYQKLEESEEDEESEEGKITNEQLKESKEWQLMMSGIDKIFAS